MSEKVEPQEGKIFTHTIFSGVLVFLAFLVPVLALLIDFRPEGEALASWFQRSGSISVFFALFSEYLLFSISGLIYMTGIWDEHEWPMRLKYGRPHSFLSFFSFIAAIWGTAIWGYGDLFI